MADSQTTTSRRAILAGTATLPALAVPSVIQATSADQGLQELWSKYQTQLAAHQAVHERIRPRRAAYDAEEPPCPKGVTIGEHWEANKWLWKLHGLDALWDESSAAFDRHLLTLKAIREAKAETLLGVAIKLAAIQLEPDLEDFLEAMHDALSAADRILATDFAAALPDLYWLSEDVEDEEEAA